MDLLKQQREVIGEYWSDYTKEQAAFTGGDSVVGTTWQVIANLVEGDKNSPPIGAVLPKEGATGMVGHLDARVRGEAPELHVPVDEPHRQPQGERRRWRSGSGRRRRTRSRVRETADEDHCDMFHADDEAVLRQGLLLDDAGARSAATTAGRTCKDYSEWVKAWTEIKG